MGGLKVYRHINNLEVVSKLMNSVAVKCNCRVGYNPEKNALIFSGDDKYKRYIVEKTAEYLDKKK